MAMDLLWMTLAAHAEALLSDSPMRHLITDEVALKKAVVLASLLGGSIIIWDITWVEKASVHAAGLS